MNKLKHQYIGLSGKLMLIKRGSDDTISEGDCIDPRGLGTQLFSAASPNQVIKFNAYIGAGETLLLL